MEKVFAYNKTAIAVGNKRMYLNIQMITHINLSLGDTHSHNSDGI